MENLFVSSRVYEVTMQHSQHDWLGFNLVTILHGENGGFDVVEEYYREIVKQSEPIETIIDKLENYNDTTMDQNTVAHFDTLEEAETYVNNNYENLNVRNEIGNMFESRITIEVLDELSSESIHISSSKNELDITVYDKDQNELCHEFFKYPSLDDVIDWLNIEGLGETRDQVLSTFNEKLGYMYNF